MFSKNIFQVWFQGCDKITRPEYLQNIKNWKMLNPNWKYACLGDSELRQACATFSQECLNTYDYFDIMHLKIDFGRYVVLYLNGGIYADMDAYAMRSLDSSVHVQELIEKSKTGFHVLGLSMINMDVLESLVTVGYTHTINNAIMMATPRNPVLKDFIETIIAKAQVNNTYYMSSIKVNVLTGPLHFNRYFKPLIEHPPDGNYIQVFDNQVFEPCKMNNCNITKNTISIHEMELSWVSKNVKMAHDGYYAIKNYLPLLLIVPLIYIFIRLQYCRCRR